MTITSNVMITIDQIGNAARNAIWMKMLKHAATIASARAQPWPALSPKPAPSCTMPQMTMIQPQAVKPVSRRSSPLFTRKYLSSSRAARPWTMLMPPTTPSMIEANTTHPVQAPPTSLDGPRVEFCVLVTVCSFSAEDLVLLGGELLLGEDPVVAELGELPELGDRIRSRRGGGGRRRRRLVALLRRVRLLLPRPAVGL